MPVPKKGDIKLCDNWRGISLLDVVGKVLGRIIVDMKKAYDSVPCSALWRVLERLQIPSTMISIIQFFHEALSVRVIVGQEFTDQSLLMCAMDSIKAVQ